MTTLRAEDFGSDFGLPMSREELREASAKLGCLIALERGMPIGRVAQAYGSPSTAMQALVHKWRNASASRWPRMPRAALSAQGSKVDRG